jgi:hypothetical protein
MRVSTSVTDLISPGGKVSPRGKYVVRCTNVKATEKGVLIIDLEYTDVLTVVGIEDLSTLKSSINGKSFTQFEMIQTRETWTESFKKDRENHIASMLAAFDVEIDSDGSFDTDDMIGRTVTIIQIPRKDQYGVVRDNVQEYIIEE